jgi:hypothetical protein
MVFVLDMFSVKIIGTFFTNVPLGMPRPPCNLFIVIYVVQILLLLSLGAITSQLSLVTSLDALGFTS